MRDVDNADAVLVATSRTFSMSILGLPPGLREAVTSAYLCTRAIDEIEDHPSLSRKAKADLLRHTSRSLQTGFSDSSFGTLYRANAAVLADVTLRLQEWAAIAPATIAPRIMDTTATMADRMAEWVERGWEIETGVDLDRYTFSVAGVVGLLLSDLWSWYDGTVSDRFNAVGFGQGLQAVNILRNRSEDLARGVDLFPHGWDSADVHAYAAGKLAMADRYVENLPVGPALRFCSAPRALARATLKAMEKGEEKLSRAEVEAIVGECAAGSDSLRQFPPCGVMSVKNGP